MASQTEELEKSHAKIDALEHLLKKCQDKLEDSVNGVSLEGISNDLKEKVIHKYLKILPREIAHVQTACLVPQI
ncbi:MAG TPA: hypothetical protein DDY16_09545 [Tenacibaculum sp.]|nr:hypothetical protein [Tenacibaculum sp.]